MPLYPAFATNKSGFLKVSDLHDVYWEECGNSQGLPVVYVHGGPGKKAKPDLEILN
jgi:proline iminopeptidase